MNACKNHILFGRRIELTYRFFRHTRDCNMLQQLPLGYKAKCKQKYVFRQLVALDEEGQTIKDLFQLPSCCQCVLIRNLN